MEAIPWPSFRFVSFGLMPATPSYGVRTRAIEDQTMIMESFERVIEIPRR